MQLIKLIASLLGVFLSCLAYGGTGEQLFQDVKLIEERQADNHAYLLPLARIKKDRASGRDLPAEYSRLTGQYQSTVWELGGGVTLKEAQQAIASLVAEPRFEGRFFCEKRDCGESFAWANAMFQQPVLYGNDRSQSLWVVKDKAANRFHLFYLIERPNRRIYFYEETLLVAEDDMSLERAEALLKRQGSVTIAQLDLENRAAGISKAVDKLKQWGVSDRALTLVVHRHGSKALALGDSMVSKELKAALTKAGIKRVVVMDVANYAPNPSVAKPCWIDWVNTDWEPGSLNKK